MFLYVNFNNNVDEYIINVSSRSAAEQIIRQLSIEEIKTIDTIYLCRSINDMIVLYFPTVQQGKIKIAKTYDINYDTNDFDYPDNITFIWNTYTAGKKFPAFLFAIDLKYFTVLKHSVILCITS